MHEYWRKIMIIGEKILTSKDWQGCLKLRLMGTTMVICWNKDKKVTHFFMLQNRKSTMNKHEINIYIQVRVFSNNYTIYEPYNDPFLSLDIYK